MITRKDKVFQQINGNKRVNWKTQSEIKYIFRQIKSKIFIIYREKRKLVIPPHLAYGKSGRPPVIPREFQLSYYIFLILVSTLVFLFFFLLVGV